MKVASFKNVSSIVKKARSIVIIQADNPDGDSLASSLALEQILSEMGKTVHLYCAVDMPNYLKYLAGWDRVAHELPHTFDASIIVDTSTISLLEKLHASIEKSWVAAKPCIVIDHHADTSETIPFATVHINSKEASSTGELIFDICESEKWALDAISAEFIASAILSDTQGLTNDLASSHTYSVMAALINLGVNRPELEEKRRQLSKMDEKIYRYKADLIKRTDFFLDNTIAIVRIPHKEIVAYSPLYNPAPLIQQDMLQVEGVAVAIVLKQYEKGRITGSIRANQSFAHAGKLAEKLGGGGHPYAAGFKILDGRSVESIISDCVSFISDFIKNPKET